MKITVYSASNSFNKEIFRILRNQTHISVQECLCLADCLEDLASESFPNVLVVDFDTGVDHMLKDVNYLVQRYSNLRILFICSSDVEISLVKKVEHKNVIAMLQKSLDRRLMSMIDMLMDKEDFYIGEYWNDAEKRVGHQYPPLFESLSPRQKEIAKAVAEGKTNEAISNELNITVATVKSHLSKIYRLINIKQRYELIKLF